MHDWPPCQGGTGDSIYTVARFGSTSIRGRRRAGSLRGPPPLTWVGESAFGGLSSKGDPAMNTTATHRTSDALGVLGLPMPVKELASRPWDAIVVGAGHNGLDLRGLPGEGRASGSWSWRPASGSAGPARLEEVWPGYRVSPCAYLVGLLASPGDRGAGPGRSRAAVGPRQRGDVRAVRRRDEPPARRGRRPVRGGDPQARPRRPPRLAGDERRQAPAPRRPPAARRRGPLDRPGPDSRADRRAAQGGRRSPQDAVRVVDGRVRRALPRRRTHPDGVPRAGGDRHQRQPSRPGDGVGPLPPRLGPAGRRARDVGVRRRRDGHGLVPALRRRAGPKGPWSPPASRSPGSCRARGSSSKAASGSMPRSSSPTPTRR